VLSSDAKIERRDADGTTSGCDPICAGDIAVLVRTHSHADLIATALDDAAVPAVINGAGSVFATESARGWLRLLEAIDRPAMSSRARIAALTPFIGWSAERIATAGESDWEGVHRRLHRWSRILREHGVAELTEAIMIDEDLPQRVLATPGGERRLTDLRHLAQLLHQTAASERLGVTALRGWLSQQMAAAAREEGEEERTRRLESDAEAVQILTIHRSKGLEFPIVYCPFLWSPSRNPPEPEPVFFHDPALGNRRTIDVGLDGAGFRKHLAQHVIEERGEELRLAYVALTRAKLQAVIWWAGAWDSQHSPLGRLLLCRDDDGNVAPDGGRTIPTDKTVLARLQELVAQAPGCIGVQRAAIGHGRLSSPPRTLPGQLAAAPFDRQLDLRWRRTSYSDITAVAHEQLVASEPEEPILNDEPSAPSAPPAAAAVAAGGGADGLDALSPMCDLPVGVAFGTFVHRVLEATDFHADELERELAEQIGHVRARRRIDLDAAAAVAGLRAAIETPLGDTAGGIRLKDLSRSDRLDELEFELPLVGGDDPSSSVTLSAIAALLRGQLEAADPLAAYASRLEDRALRSTLRGFLTGSIDLVVRLPGPRFAIVDYKTNWLGPADEPLTLGHYQPDALAAEMSRAHYALQALLYSVALHRYLRWRLPGYDPERHLAGTMYLFLRGMAGADTPTLAGSPCGVFGWRPPAALIASLSDVLDRGAV
jgi:exodeoxyribonuclease V beta subunit